MHTIAEIQKVKQTAEGTDLIIHIPKLPTAGHAHGEADPKVGDQI